MRDVAADATPLPSPAEGPAWEAAEEVLRARYAPHGELHMVRRLADLPPFQFAWWSSPDCQNHTLVYGGRVLHGGGLPAFADYARAVDLALRSDLRGGCLALLHRFDALPVVSFLTSTSYESSGDLGPRVEASDGVLRCVLHYVDGGAALAHHRAALADRTAPLRPHGEGAWTHTFEIALPMVRATLVLGREGPVEWAQDAATTAGARSYVVFGDELPWWRRLRWRAPIG